MQDDYSDNIKITILHPDGTEEELNEEESKEYWRNSPLRFKVGSGIAFEVAYTGLYNDPIDREVRKRAAFGSHRGYQICSYCRKTNYWETYCEFCGAILPTSSILLTEP